MEMKPTEIGSLKTRLRDTWAAGDYGQIARSTQSGADEFVHRLNLRPGTLVLDVACGTGNLAIPAASTGAHVTGIDIAANLVEQARERANEAGVTATFEVGDAESISYGDGSFDVVISMFGAMFGPRPDVVTAELKRVTKPGGLIAMANWTPQGFAGQVLKLIGKYVPAPPEVAPPLLWGDEEAIRKRFSEGISDLQLSRQNVEIIYPFGPAQVVEHFRAYFGPTVKAFDALDDNGKNDLRKDLEKLWGENNKATDGTTLVNSEYLEVRATRA